MNRFRVAPLGDAAVIVEWSEKSPSAAAVARSVELAAVKGVLDVVPALGTVVAHFDPLKTSMKEVTAAVEQEAANASREPGADGLLHRIPVCYGGEWGPDLGDVAVTAGMTSDAVVSRHVVPTYRVEMLGFMPGFAYLGTLDPLIAVPRRATPRVRIAAGSVAIAGRQTGIYPLETPGGWHVIGRTPVRPFDPGRAEPFLFAPGDRVQFYAVDASAFGSETLCPLST